jgi:alcohol dehydrogenase (cytochrome c)
MMNMLGRIGLFLILTAVVAAAQSTTPITGATSYATRCAVCHGGAGSGTDRGPSIIRSLVQSSDEHLVYVITEGTEGGMPPQAMPDAELQSLTAHLRTMRPRRFRGPQRRTVLLSDGGRMEGLVLGESSFDINVRTDDGKTHRLLRRGTSETFSPAPILPKMDWKNYDNGDNNRYLDADQIDRNNVGNLALHWMFPVLNTSRLEATPIVVDGVMYTTGWNEAWALDATTGRRLWSYRQDRTKGLISEAGRSANRGVSLNDDHVYMITDHAHLLALNRWTGEKVWDTEMADYRLQYSATAAPLVVGDLVISGIAGGEEGVRGFLDAYDAKTGERAWRFWTIPTRDDPEASTWIGNALEHGCGATWLTGTYDADLDLLYWTVGNPCPDYDGSQRLGDNLYTNSVLALRPKTGELVWYYQFTPHDTHDWDAQQPTVLVDTEWRGNPRKLIVQSSRNGMLYVLDRINGKFLQATKTYDRVNWNHGIDKNGRPILAEGEEATPEGSIVCPGAGGGSNWQSAAYNPVTKLFYATLSETCANYKSIDQEFELGRRYFGGTASSVGERRRYIRAFNIETGEKVWDFPLRGTGRNGSGTLSTKGGLVFSGEEGGGFMALDATTGEKLWSVDLNQRWAASPMSYVVGGKQYVAIAGAIGFFAFGLPD